MIDTLGLESANGMSERKNFSLFGTWAYACCETGAGGAISSRT